MSIFEMSSPKVRGVVALSLILGLPLGYVLLNRSPTPKVEASVAASTSEESALSHWEQIVRSDPTTANRINLSQAYVKTGMYGRAIAILEPVTTQEPTNGIAWNNLCVARTLQREYNLGVEACQKGIKADPSLQLLRNNLQWVEGEREKVMKVLAQQEATDPAHRDSTFYLNEGLNQLHLGSYDQAEKAWRRALAIQPQSAILWNDLGTAQMMRGHFAEGKASFLRAQTLDPGSQLIQNNVHWAENSMNGTP